MYHHEYDVSLFVEHSVVTILKLFMCMHCAAVKAVRDFSSGQFVKISSIRVERTTTVLLTSGSVIDVRHVATSAAYKLE